MLFPKPLPQLTATRPFLSDGGVETTLVFKKGLDLPEFASFPLFDNPSHLQTVSDCFIPYVKIALEHRTGIVLESSTWRASLPWIRKLGYPDSKVVEANHVGIQMLKEIRNKHQTKDTPIVISGCLGPLGDAYKPLSSSSDANEFHARLAEVMDSYRCQVSALAAAGADMISIMTVSQAEEAMAAVLLARDHGLPVLVSLTLETNGKLPDGRTVAQFIKQVDDATDVYASYFGINCAHPNHFAETLRNLSPEEEWVRGRISQVRANASDKSHDELDNSEELDRGEPLALGKLHAGLVKLLPNLKVVGGCCGTDEEHVSEMAKAIL